MFNYQRKALFLVIMKGSFSYEISNSAKYEWFVMTAKGKVKTQYSC